MRILIILLFLLIMIRLLMLLFFMVVMVFFMVVLGSMVMIFFIMMFLRGMLKGGIFLFVIFLVWVLKCGLMNLIMRLWRVISFLSLFLLLIMGIFEIVWLCIIVRVLVMVLFGLSVMMFLVMYFLILFLLNFFLGNFFKDGYIVYNVDYLVLFFLIGSEWRLILIMSLVVLFRFLLGLIMGVGL